MHASLDCCSNELMRLDHWSTSTLHTYQRYSRFISLQCTFSEHSLVNDISHHHLHFNICFPGEPGLEIPLPPPAVSFLHLFWKRIFGNKVAEIFMGQMPSCYPNNCVKALKVLKALISNRNKAIIDIGLHLRCAIPSPFTADNRHVQCLQSSV